MLPPGKLGVESLAVDADRESTVELGVIVGHDRRRRVRVFRDLGSPLGVRHLDDLFFGPGAGHGRQAEQRKTHN
jgi:hypothetical protein